LDDLNADAVASELDQCEHVVRLRDTEGWKILARRIESIREEQLAALLAIPILAENLGEIALTQTKVNACRLVFDEVEAFANRRREIIELRDSE
jgi:hypothetical protein